MTSQDDRRPPSVTDSTGEQPASDDGARPRRAPAKGSRSFIRVAAMAALTLAVGWAAVVLVLLLWPPSTDEAVQLVRGQLLGEAEGYIAHVDHDRRVVSISRSPGSKPVTLTVNPDTVITLRDGEGALGDIAKDMPVHVTYEVAGDRRLARVIELGGTRAEVAPPEPSVVPPAPSVVKAATPGPDAVAAAPEPRVSERPAPPVPSARHQAVESARPVAPEPPSALVRSPAAREPAPRTETPRPSSQVSAASSAPRQESTDGDPADARAIIDWLISQPRGR